MCIFLFVRLKSALITQGRPNSAHRWQGFAPSSWFSQRTWIMNGQCLAVCVFMRSRALRRSFALTFDCLHDWQAIRRRLEGRSLSDWSSVGLWTAVFVLDKVGFDIPVWDCFGAIKARVSFVSLIPCRAMILRTQRQWQDRKAYFLTRWLSPGICKRRWDLASYRYGSR